MEKLSVRERNGMQTPLREYWIKRDGLLPKETRAFEAGFRAGIEYQKLETADTDAQIAALQAENARLRKACEAALDWINDFGMHSPTRFGGEAELANKLTEVLGEE